MSIRRPNSSDVVAATKMDYVALKTAANANIRRRMLKTLHTSHQAELHTMINVFKKESYAAPHCHWVETADQTIKKGESFLALEGSGLILLFDDDRDVKRIIALKAAEQTMVWIPAGVWHTVVATSDYLILFENKTGPWQEGLDKIFHPKFPKEDDPKDQKLVSDWQSLAPSP